VIQDGGRLGGSGSSLTKTGSGTLTLTGTNTYTGATAIDGGTLQLGNGGTTGSIVGNVVDNGVLAINRSNAITLGGVISGTGALVQQGPGTTILTADNTYTGGTTIDGGTLQLGNGGTTGSIAGNVVDNGVLAIDRSNAIALAGVISGTGVVNLNGTGSATLSGANTYTGGTNVNAGTLVIGNNNALGTGQLSLAAGTELSFLNTGNFTIANSIAISGDPAFTPSAGTIQTLAGVISDGTSPGTLDMNGAGTLVLTAANTYSGPTNVNNGTLRVDGSIASSSLTGVNDGGTLVGTGTVGNTRINSGGIFAPGTPGVPGTAMTVSGNLTFQNGATYLVQLDPSTTTLANITGNATLAGNVLAAFASGNYVIRQYTILRAAALSGTFNALATTNLPNFTETLSYTNTDVLLNLQASLGKSGGEIGGLNGNQQNVANSINSFFNSGGALTPNFLTIFGLSGGNLATALSELSGEAAADAQQGAFQLMTQFLGLMVDPSVDGRSGIGGAGPGGSANAFAPERQVALPPDIALAYTSMLKAPAKPAFDARWNAWGSAYGGANRTDGDPAVIGSNDLTARIYGIAGGMDYHFTPDVLAGFALAGGGTNWSLAQGLGGGRSQAFQGGVYGMARTGSAYVAAAFAYANHWMSTDRYAFAGDHLIASFNGYSYGGRLEAGYRVAMPIIALTPYAAVQAQDFHTPSYSETDVTGGGFALAYASRSATDTRSELGARFDRLVMVGSNMPMTLRARAAWAHDWVSDPSLMATFQALPGASFIVNGASPAKDSALASVGSELHVTPALSLSAKFDGEFANGSQTYSGTGTLSYTW
jgi:autotransporter-associated beta strand protein